MLAPAVDAVATTLGEARDALAFLAGAPNDVQLLHARRLTYLLADLTEGALLVDEATWALHRDGDARKAVVARRFARERLSAPRAAASSTPTTAPSSTTSTRSCATAPSIPPIAA